jgi:hypothetical protein
MAAKKRKKAKKVAKPAKVKKAPAKSRKTAKKSAKPSKAKKVAKKNIKTSTAKAPAKKAVKSSRKAPSKTPSKTKGEGDYAASRRFLKDQSGFVEKNKAAIPAMGKEAEAALDGPQGAALREAEATAAARSRDTF